MDRERVRRRAEQEIVRLCHAGLDSRTLRVEALRRLRTVVPVDALFCATVDPATLLFTGSLPPWASATSCGRRCASGR